VGKLKHAGQLRIGNIELVNQNDENGKDTLASLIANQGLFLQNIEREGKLQQILRSSGTQFDPNLAQIFVDMIIENPSI